MYSDKRTRNLGLGAIFLVLLVFFGWMGASFLFPPLEKPIKKDLGRFLGIASRDLIVLQTGSDAGGCSWDSSKVDEARKYKKAVEKLLRMSALETQAGIPEGCANAYYAADDINMYTFTSGVLTIPPSGQYPPPDENGFRDYYRVVFKRNDGSMPVEFCLEKAEFERAVKELEAEPSLADCEI